MRLQKTRSRLERLGFLPVAGAIIGIWIFATLFTLSERSYTLERVESQLNTVITTLADFNELAEVATGDAIVKSADKRTAAIWRALLEYPSASIWVESDGEITGGQPPPENLVEPIVVQDVRENFTVNAAMPAADALADWRRSAWQRAIVLFLASIVFLLLSILLIRALRQRASAEEDAVKQRERAVALDQYKTELEWTVDQRTQELSEANGRLEQELIERKAANEKIALMARTDGLTGLVNRRAFTERLQHAFVATKRNGNPFAILCLDLDHFKPVNDTLGHHAGDVLLCEVADRLKSCCRETDIVARLGGDEFAIIQMDMHEPADAGALAAAVQREVAKPYLIDGSEVHVTASIGVCPYSADSANPDEMLSQADRALYRSKEEGRNRYRFHTDDLDDEVLERMTLTDELRTAIERNELELHYQPQVELASGRIVGMEALVHWNHPKRGLMHAAEFMPVAEKTGAVVAVGQWVLKEACRQWRTWLDSGVHPGVLTINLSFARLKNRGELLDEIKNVLEEFRLSPNDLSFDVTEATLAKATLMHNETLAELRVLGAHISIADFGGAYSSLDYLRTYQVNHLKIAQSFDDESIDNRDRAKTTRVIVNLAQELGIDVITSGVETRQRRERTGETSNIPRGIFLNEALEANAVVELLKAGRIGPSNDDGRTRDPDRSKAAGRR